MEENINNMGSEEKLVMDMIGLKSSVYDMLRTLAASIDDLYKKIGAEDAPTDYAERLEYIRKSLIRVPMNVRASMRDDMKVYELLQLFSNAINEISVNTNVAIDKNTVVTPEKDGIMSKEDKVKLDGIIPSKIDDAVCNIVTEPQERSVRISFVTNHGNECYADIPEAGTNGKAGVISAADKDRLIRRTNIGHVLNAQYEQADVYTWGDKTILTPIVRQKEGDANSFEMFIHFTSDDVYAVYTSSNGSPWTCKKVYRPNDTTLLAEEVRAVFHNNIASNNLPGLMDPTEKHRISMAYFDCDISRNANSNIITLTYSKDEDEIIIESASQTKAGLLNANDKKKLDGIEAGAQKNPGVATTDSDGLMSAADKVLLNDLKIRVMGIDVNLTREQTGGDYLGEIGKLHVNEGEFFYLGTVDGSHKTGVIVCPDGRELTVGYGGVEVNETMYGVFKVKSGSETKLRVKIE